MSSRLAIADHTLKKQLIFLFSGTTIYTFISAIFLWQIDLSFSVLKNRHHDPLSHKRYTIYDRQHDHRNERLSTAYLIISNLCIIPLFFLTCATGSKMRSVGNGWKKGVGLLIIWGLMIVMVGSFGVSVWFVFASGDKEDEMYGKDMKNICEGFDTRVVLDNSTSESYAMSTIVLENSSPSFNETGRNGFIFSNHTEISKEPSDPFFYFHRMNGSLTPGSSLAIDFDLVHNSWRTIDTTNLEDIPLTITEPRTTGTWSKATESSPHMYFRTLNLVIPDMYYYPLSCYFERYMRVLSTSPLPSSSITSLFYRPWDFPSPHIVMRTAGIGDQFQEIMVCAKRSEELVLNEDKTGFNKRKGLSDEGLMVTLGLLAVIRREHVPRNRYGHFYPCEHKRETYREDRN